MKTTINAVLFTLLISMASVSYAEYGYYNDEPVTEEDIIVDMAMARPLGLLGSAVGIVLQGFGLLFSVPGENFAETGEVLVEDPLNYTFNRPLGRFENN